jgi:competence protein ComEC
MLVSFINVGYGDSILVENYNEHEKFVALIDGGVPGEEHYRNSPDRIKTIDYLKERNIEKIDLLVITHLHEDHVGGLLEIVKNIEVEELWCSYIFPSEYINRKISFCSDYGEGEVKLINSLNSFTEICNILLDRGKTLKQIHKNMLDIDIGQLLKLDILVPTEGILFKLKELIHCIYNDQDKSTVKLCLKKLDSLVNNTSLVLRFMYKDKKVLLASDAYSSYWKEKLENLISIEADILKLPHHGHLDGISKDFLKAVNPSYIIISVSNDRTDNCPNPKVIELIRNYSEENNKNIKILFTDAVKMQGINTAVSHHEAIVFELNNYISLI